MPLDPFYSIAQARMRIYTRLVSQAGLYAVAFYGHKADSMQQRMLNILWQRSLREAKAEANA